MDELDNPKGNSGPKIKGAYDHLRNQQRKPIPSSNTTTPKVFKLFFVFVLILILLTGLGVFSPNNNGIFNNRRNNQDQNNNQGASNGILISAVLYSSPSCGCCHNYVNIMNDNGFDVFQKRTEDYLDIKDQNNIPEAQRSCHTMIVNDYFVEGHIPVDVVMALLNTNPQVDGIALAGMPSGSPGMGGPKVETWNIYSIINGQADSIFMSV